MDEDQARREAEARRQRILDEANDRLGLVTGEKPKNIDAADGDDEAAAPAKLSGSARLAAMRKRRFKAKAAAAKTDEAETDTARGEEPEKDEAPVVEETVAVEETPAETKPEEPAAHLEPEPTNERHEELDEGSETFIPEESFIPAAASNKNQKKYMGVARMRRQKLKERQDATQDATTTSASSLDSVIAADKVAAVMARKQRRVALLPILMHFITTMLLFLAGFDVGWQQNNPILMANVHTELAPRQVGFKILQRGSNKLIDKFHTLSGNSVASIEALSEGDEFDDVKSMSDDEDSAEPNLDPLFKIDLDKLTEEDTILNRLAKVAIFVHRSILKFILLPKTIAGNMISGFAQLLTIPPLLCLVALFIRQFVGKIVLGAKLPDIKPPDESEGKDVVSMGKNFVKGFITSAFPKVFSIYDAWSHLRKDMFVVLCGLIVGFSMQYQLQMMPLSTRIPAEEIIVVHAPPAEPVMTETMTTGDEL